MKNYIFWVFILLNSLASAQKKQPNIIFILSDDHAFQAIGAYGNALASTPNIDRLAKEGMRFDNAIVTNSICGPSRASLLTGQYSHKNGYKVNDGVLDTNQVFLPEILGNNGYQTAWIGKWHLGSLPRGFSYWNVMPAQGHYFNPDFINQNNDTIAYHGYVSDLITSLTTDYLDKRDPNKPFFLVVGEKATHREWLPAIQDLGAFDSVTFPLPQNFYDNYAERQAAARQQMSIDKSMTLKSDLKVGQPFGVPLISKKQTLSSSFDPNDIQASTARYYEQGEYAGMDSVQSRAYNDYFGKRSKTFAASKLEGKALIEWKFQQYNRDYYSTAKSLDRNIGAIMDYLETNGLMGNTIIIYASDQGFYLGEHGWFDKRFMYEESLRTPLIIRMPNSFKIEKKKINQLVSNVDWAPTILDMAGIAPSKSMQGKSFLPVLKNPKIKNWSPEGSYYHYYEYPGPHYVSPHFGIRTDNYTLIRFYNGVETWELYDLKKDPTEVRNLIADPAYQTIKESLKVKLKSLILKYEDEEALTILNRKI
ncbi:sulfatase [Pedobacter sp. AW1-32]|uniref:sulfatase family protein n=1 Tax=Pedobacter sp. AW1-32 TaxID=3383026 RepID=UPI003FEE0617